MRKRLSYLLIPAALLLLGSCLFDRQFIEGRAELVSISDSTLHDSSIFVGHVYRVDWTGNDPYDAIPFEIWIENTKYSTSTDSAGYYFIKVMPGTYTIRSQSKYNEWEQLIEEKRNVKIEKNKKIQIDFYIGYIIELR